MDSIIKIKLVHNKLILSILKSEFDTCVVAVIDVTNDGMLEQV